MDSKSSKMSCSSVLYELIVAVNPDSIIGITDSAGNQRIPWKNKEDMRHFRETTMGHILIMGRKTFESLPNGPLPGRIHIVLSRTPELPQKHSPCETHTSFLRRIFQFLRSFFAPELPQKRGEAEDTTTTPVYFATIKELDEMVLSKYPGKRIFVCGGEEIYRILLPKCERLHITEIQHSIEFYPGETASHFPLLAEWISGFQETRSTKLSEKCVCKTYERIPS
jgi:dihydrofolate reductase